MSKWEIRKKGLCALCAYKPLLSGDRGNACLDHQINAVPTEWYSSVLMWTGENEQLRIVFYENKRSFNGRTFSCLSALLIDVYSFFNVPWLSQGWCIIYLILQSPSEHWAWSYITWYTCLAQRGMDVKTHMLQNELKAAIC